MNKALVSIFVWLVVAASGTALELRGQVHTVDENGKQVPVAAANVRVEETRATAVADASGHFVIDLPTAFRPGDVITLFAGTDDLVSMAGRVRIPKDPEALVEIELVRKGSDRFLTDEGIVGIVFGMMDAMARVADQSLEAEETYSFDLRAWMARYGLRFDEFQPAFDRWSRETRTSTDPLHRGLASFALGDLATAADAFAAAQETAATDDRRRAQELEYLVASLMQDHERAVRIARQFVQQVSRTDNPYQWARSQSRLGAALGSLGIRVTPDKASALLEESISAYRSALEVQTRDAFPDARATTQNRLGMILAEQGVRSSGDTRIQLLDQSLEAFAASRQVFTADAMTGRWLTIRQNEARVLEGLGRSRDVADVLEGMLEVDPGNQEVSRQLVVLLHDTLFDYPRALEVVTTWANQENAHVRIVLHVLEISFANRRFAAALEIAEPLAALADDNPVFAVMLRGYRAASLLALDRKDEAEAVLAGLAIYIEALPVDFEPGWGYVGTRNFVETNADLPYRDVMRALFVTLEAPDRDGLVEGLRGVQGQLSSR
ncbi:MAG: hypothetical protein AAGD38_20245 [Acidobacteriota bacterium]